MSGRMIPSDFLKNAAQNGIGRYVCQLQRLTLKFCKESPGSLGMRDYIENYMLDFANKNPGVVVYLKPRRHRAAVIVGEYLNGEMQQQYCNNLSDDEVARWVDHLRTRSGREIVRFRKLWHTEIPSIQGVWHPLLNQDPDLNTTNFPDDSISSYQPDQDSATDYVRSLSKTGFSSSEDATDEVVSSNANK